MTNLNPHASAGHQYGFIESQLMVLVVAYPWPQGTQLAPHSTKHVPLERWGGKMTIAVYLNIYSMIVDSMIFEPQSVFCTFPNHQQPLSHCDVHRQAKYLLWLQIICIELHS